MADVQMQLLTGDDLLGRVLPGETGFHTRGDDRTVRAPDVVFYLV